MESVYSKLALAKEGDSIWTAKIIVDMPTPHSLLNVFDSGSSEPSSALLKVNKNTIDIVLLLNPPSIATKFICW